MKRATEQLGQFQPNLAQSILVSRGFVFVQMKNYFNSQKVDNRFFHLLINVMIKSYVFIDLNCFLRWAMWTSSLFMPLWTFFNNENEDVLNFQRSWPPYEPCVPRYYMHNITRYMQVVMWHYYKMLTTLNCTTGWPNWHLTQLWLTLSSTSLD